MHTESISYKSDGHLLKGYLCYNRGITGKRPGILIAHAWYGLDAFAKHKAEALARLGYIAFAADVYGNDKPITNDQEAQQMMMPLFLNRSDLRERITAGYQVLAEQSMVDPDRLGAIGFCFGGLTVIELFRACVGLKAAVSFHGLLGHTLGNQKAAPAPKAGEMKGSLLILHGYKDPLVSPQDIVAIQKEMTDAGVDWQMDIYGNASHAFMNPEAHDPKSGLLYDELTARRAWQAMNNFFDEVFKR
jgi:dienelactone hydrolase